MSKLMNKLSAAMQYEVERYGLTVPTETKIGVARKGGSRYTYMDRPLKDVWFWTYRSLLNANKRVQKVVDYGSGDGGHLLTALSVGNNQVKDVWLNDINEENLSLAKNHHRASGYNGAVELIDICDQPMNVRGEVVFLINTLQYVDNPYRAIENAFFSVEKGGCLIIAVPNKVWTIDKQINLKGSDIAWNWAPWELMSLLIDEAPRGASFAGIMTLWPPKSTRPAREGAEKEFHFGYTPIITQNPEAIAWGFSTIAVLTKK